MKNYNINTLLDKHNFSAYYNLYCPIALQAQTLTSWKDYYFPDFADYTTNNGYSCKNLGFRDSLLVDTKSHSEFIDAAGQTKTWESGTQFINNYRPSNSADNLDNEARLKETNYLILPPSSNYFYVPGYFERDGATIYGFQRYFDKNSEVAKYGYRWSALTNGNIPRYFGEGATNILHRKFAISGQSLPYLRSLETQAIGVRGTPQRFPKPIDELIRIENHQLETTVADSLINNYDDPQRDQARYDYKFSYQLTTPSEDGSNWYVPKEYVANWALLLV